MLLTAKLSSLRNSTSVKFVEMDTESNSGQDFVEYLKSKKIDPKKFEDGDRDSFDQFKELFDQVHPSSFTQQKLFLINRIRRKYLYEEQGEATQSAAPKKIKPKIKPKLS